MLKPVGLSMVLLVAATTLPAQSLPPDSLFDRLIGNCGLFGFDWKNRFAEFGILIGEKDAWGHGYGTDAARLILRFGFDELNLNRVWLRVYDFNPRAGRAYKKAGYVQEGIYRQALYREGAYHDIHVMSVLRDEWQAQRSG